MVIVKVRETHGDQQVLDWQKYSRQEKLDQEGCFVYLVWALMGESKRDRHDEGTDWSQKRKGKQGEHPDRRELLLACCLVIVTLGIATLDLHYKN